MLEEPLELIRTPGASGFEGPDREAVEAEARLHAKTSVDGMGDRMVPLGLPIRRARSPVECVRFDDLDGMVRSLEALVLDIDQGGWDAKKV